MIPAPFQCAVEGQATSWSETNGNSRLQICLVSATIHLGPIANRLRVAWRTKTSPLAGSASLFIDLSNSHDDLGLHNEQRSPLIPVHRAPSYPHFTGNHL